MAYYVYQSRQFVEDAQRASVSQQMIDRQIVHWVESRQSIGCFDRFPMPFLTKKKFAGYNNRVIAAEEIVEHDGVPHNVVVLLRLVTRSSKVYDSYGKDPEGAATPWLNAERPYLRDWLAGYKPKCIVQPHPAPDAAENAFLFDCGSTVADDDFLICESHEWLADIRHKAVSNRLMDLCRLVGEIVGAVGSRIEPFEDLIRRHDLCVRYRVFPPLRKILLLRVTHQTPPVPDGQALEDADKQVLRRCARAYASLLLADEDRWMEIERAEEGTPNLALSPEEAQVLESSRGTGGGFPMFINGRAGSGKSTVLQYLFSDTIRSWRRNCADGELSVRCPIYLAANNELLAKARRNVVSLLRHNANAVIASEQVADDAWLEQLGEHAFQTTAAVLRSQLPEAQRGRFEDRDRITYGRFRELWMEQFGKQPKMLKQCGPQISWHVIRSFIKGLAIDGYLESVEDFEETPRAERNISTEVFKLVFDRVWLAWYKDLTSAGWLWDDQDLARAVLDAQADAEPQLNQRDHLAVFCDEAQDLTRPEIECLYRVCAFSRRTLDRETARRVPFVFAGDPFQTLNPTGFRWEAMKSSFNERLTSNLVRYAQGQDAIRLNYQELSHNYRSMRPVVNFCNSIQCVRAVATEAEVRPQESWTTTNDAPQPMYFHSDDEGFARALRQQQDLTIVVPCEEGEEADFVRGAPFLKALVQWDADERVPQDVYSAIRAKGLEFKRILLFGFGQQEEAQILKQILRTDAASVQPPREDLLKLEYFLNKLYVGASRAMRRLFIVDDQAAFQQGGLWSHFADDPKLQAVIQRLPATQHTDWLESTTTMVPGGTDALGQDRDDPNTLAENYERDGMAQRSSYSLRQAAGQWRRARNLERGAAAEAQAAEWDGLYLRAGELFEEAGNLPRALQALFDGGEYARIGPIAARDRNLANCVEARVASLLDARSFSIREFASLVNERAQISNGAPLAIALPGNLGSHARALAAALKRAATISAPPGSDAQAALRPIVQDCYTLLRAGLSADLLRLPLAEVAERCGDFDTILSLYSSEPNSPIARRAQAELILMGRRPSVTGDDIRTVARLLKERKEPIAAASWFLRCDDGVAASGCIADALAAGLPIKTLELRAAFTSLVEWLIRDLAWRDLLSLFDRYMLPGRPSAQSGDSVRLLLDDLRVIEQRFIPFVARQTTATLDPIANDLVAFLRQYLGDSLPKWKRWRSRVRVEHVATAFERANNLVAALQFYELLLTDPNAAPHEIAFAKRRWLRCKARQIEIEKARARSGVVTKTSHVSKLEDDVRRFCQRNGVKAEDAGEDSFDTSSIPIEPSVPTLPAVNSVQIPALASEVVQLPQMFDVKHFAAKGRIRIESPNGDTIVVNTATKAVESQDYSVIEEEPGAWRIDGLEASIAFGAGLVIIQINSQVWSFALDGD